MARIALEYYTSSFQITVYVARVIRLHAHPSSVREIERRNKKEEKVTRGSIVGSRTLVGLHPTCS